MSELLPKKTTSLLEIDLQPTRLYVRFLGPQVGQRESPIISQDVEPYLKASTTLKHFIVDLQSVTFMSSMGLGICIALRHKANAVGAKSILYGTPKDLLALFVMMKIDKLYLFAQNQRELDSLLS